MSLGQYFYIKWITIPIYPNFWETDGTKIKFKQRLFSFLANVNCQKTENEI